VRCRYLYFLAFMVNECSQREHTTCLRSHSCVIEKGFESRKSDSRVSKDNSWLVEVLNSLSSSLTHSHIPLLPVKENPFPLPLSFSLPSPWFYFFCYLCLGCSPHCFIFPHKAHVCLGKQALANLVAYKQTATSPKHYARDFEVSTHGPNS